MIKVYTDAAFNPKTKEAGIAINIQRDGQQFAYKLYAASVSDNHLAEFIALDEALKILEAEGLLAETLFFYSDSRIVVESVEKEHVKEARYQSFLVSILARYREIELAFIQWVPEKENRGADALAKQALHRQGKLYREIE